MKKLMLFLLTLCFITCGNSFCFAENLSEFVKVIYSSTAIYADTNINEDHNQDNISDILCQKSYGTKLKLLNTQKIIGDDNLQYYMVEINNETYGYVLCSNVLSLDYASPIKDLDSNATISKSAEVYILENLQYKKTEITLTKNQEIKILDGYNKNIEYTRIQYKDQDGQILTAYIKTNCIKTSPISRSTIGAIIIVITTISLVLVVFGIKGKNKKKLKGVK